MNSDNRDYEIFRDPIDRQNVFDACKRAADFAVDNEVGSMVFIDRAARPMNVGIREYYRMHYPDDEIPSMFFVNPNGFYRPVASIFNPGLVKRKLEKQHPYLMGRNDRTTMVVDTCMHTGKSALPVVSGLSKAGFRDGFLTIVHGKDNFSGILPSKVLLDDRPDMMVGCYPFGDISPVAKSRHDVICQKDDRGYPELMAQYTHLKRQEIKRIIHDYSDYEHEIEPVPVFVRLAVVALDSVSFSA